MVLVFKVARFDHLFIPSPILLPPAILNVMVRTGVSWAKVASLIRINTACWLADVQDVACQREGSCGLLSSEHFANILRRTPINRMGTLSHIFA